MSNRALALTTAALLSMFSARPCAAEPASANLTSQSVVTLAIQHNPSLHVALLQASQASYAVTAEEAFYDPVFGANASYEHDRVPALRTPDGTIVSTTDKTILGASLTKAFPTGTTVQASVGGQRQTTVSPQPNGMGPDVTLGPAYSALGQLKLTQPLLRGAGTTLGLSSLRIARLNRNAANLLSQQTASELLRTVLNAYWELWYATEVVRIDEAARDLAHAQEQQANEQVKSGTLADVDALPYRTETAKQDGLLDAAIADRRQRALDLALAVGRDIPTGAEWRTAEAPADVVPEDIGDRAIEEALAASYELKQLQAQLQIAEYQAKIAGDAQRPRLDLSASVTAQGLGNRRVPPAFEQLEHLSAVSASVGLVFEAPVTDTRRSAIVEQALLAVHIAEKQIESLRLQLTSNLRSASTRRDAARRRLELALITERVAQAQAAGAQGKFLAGTALAIEVQKANSDYQGAQLNVTRARVDLVESEIELLDLRGLLLEHYSDALKAYQPTARILQGASSPM